MFKNGMRPVHPGEVLREDYLKPLRMSANALAKALSVPAPRINEVVRERRGISADTAMRLARYFGGDARSWLDLQGAYDLRVAEISNAKRIAREVSPGPTDGFRVKLRQQWVGRVSSPVMSIKMGGSRSTARAV
jgi:antitoxin HigA-1